MQHRQLIRASEKRDSDKHVQTASMHDEAASMLMRRSSGGR